MSYGLVVYSRHWPVAFRYGKEQEGGLVGPLRRLLKRNCFKFQRDQSIFGPGRLKCSVVSVLPHPLLGS